MAQIQIDKKAVYLGSFTDEKQASETYQTALKMHSAGEVVTLRAVRDKISSNQ